MDLKGCWLRNGKGKGAGRQGEERQSKRTPRIWAQELGREGCQGQWVVSAEELALLLEWGADTQSRVVPWLSLDRCHGQDRQGILTSFAAWARAARSVLLSPPKVVLGTGAHWKPTTCHLELFRDFLDGRPTPHTGAE